MGVAGIGAGNAADRMCVIEHGGGLRRPIASSRQRRAHHPKARMNSPEVRDIECVAPSPAPNDVPMAANSVA